MTIVFSFSCGAGFPAALPAQEAGHPLFGVAIRSSVLEKRFSRQYREEEKVCTFILNSNVTGTQSTVTDTTLRIVPDEKSLRFDFMNAGEVTSQATGIHRDALVDSIGSHHFEITKPFWFDGSTFLTRPGYGTIQAFQTPRRVVSAVGASMPLLSPLADRVAWDEVMRRQPQINQAVAEDVSRDVLPKIDRITDGEFAELGREWKTIQQTTNRIFGATALRWAARSTDSIAAIWVSEASSAGSQDIALPIPEAASQLEATDEVLVFTSENAVGTLLSQYFPRGLKLTDSQLQQLQSGSDEEAADAPFFMEQLKRRFAEIVSAEPAAAVLFTLEFPPENPVDVKFAGGDVRITTTFQIHPKLGASSGWMTTCFNFRGRRLPDDYWTLSVRSIDVGSANVESPGIAAGSESGFPPMMIIPSEEKSTDDADVTTVQAGTAWIPIIRAAATSISEKMPPVKLPLEVDGSAFFPEAPRLRLSRIESAGGMLRVAFRVVDQSPPLPAGE